MKKVIFILVIVSLQACLGTHRVDVWKTISIQPGEQLVIQEVEAPTDIEIKNQSNEPVEIFSRLRVPQRILGHSNFTYRLPKRGAITLENKNLNIVSIHLHYSSSSRSVIVNNKELR